MNQKDREANYYNIQKLGVELVTKAILYEKERITKEDLAMWNANINDIVNEIRAIQERTIKAFEKEVV